MYSANTHQSKGKPNINIQKYLTIMSYFPSTHFRASLVPVYSFGETDVYEQVPNPDGSSLRRLQNWLTKMIGFAPPVFHGRGIFNYSVGLLPYRKPIYTVGEFESKVASS